MDVRCLTGLPQARGAQRQMDHLQPTWQCHRSQDAQSSPRGDKMSERTLEEIHQKFLPSASINNDSNCILQVVGCYGDRKRV